MPSYILPRCVPSEQTQCHAGAVHQAHVDGLCVHEHTMHEQGYLVVCVTSAQLCVQASIGGMHRLQARKCKDDFILRLSLSCCSSVGRNHQTHLQHSTQDVAQLCRPPAHPARRGWGTCPQSRTSKVRASTLLDSAEARWLPIWTSPPAEGKSHGSRSHLPSTSSYTSDDLH